MIQPGPWNPTKLPGCVLWARASVGNTIVGGYVTKVADQSVFHNDSTSVVGNIAITSNAIGTMPGWTMTGGESFNNNAATLWGQDAARHVFYVGKATTNSRGIFTNGGQIFSSANSGPDWCAALATTSGSSSGYFCDGSGASTIVSPPAIANTPIIGDLAATAGTGAGLLTQRLNGSLYALSPGTKFTEGSAKTGYIFGQGGAGSQYGFAGYCCEILAFNRVLSALEASNVRRYFSKIYAITVTG